MKLSIKNPCTEWDVYENPIKNFKWKSFEKSFRFIDDVLQDLALGFSIAKCFSIMLTTHYQSHYRVSLNFHYLSPALIVFSLKAL